MQNEKTALDLEKDFTPLVIKKAVAHFINADKHCTIAELRAKCEELKNL